MRPRPEFPVYALLTVVVLWSGALAAADARLSNERLARELLTELVAIDTSPSGPGGTVLAARAMADRLRAAGFPSDDVQVLGPTTADGNLVARFRSAAPVAPPILLLAHIDVVAAVPSDWATNPFRLVEKDGYWYGRGTRDIKDGAAALVANFIRLRAEGFRPSRDLIVLLSANEETTGDSVKWLLREHRPLVDAAFALNTDAGRVDLVNGRAKVLAAETAEKTYASFTFEARSPSGHSSRPLADNSIYQLARALQRVAAYRFPRDLNETTRSYFREWTALAPPDLQPGARAIGAGRLDDPAVATLEQSPYLNALLRTTCVATQVSGGIAENVLPERASAVINCRILPQSSPAVVEATLRALAAPELVAVTPVAPADTGPPSPLDPVVLGPALDLARELWPGVQLLPEMGLGASDGIYFRAAGIPVYGVGAVPEDPDEDTSHAANERIRIAAFNESLEYWYRLVKRLAM